MDITQLVVLSVRCKKWRNSLRTRQSEFKKAFLFAVAEFLFRISKPGRYKATRIFSLVRKQTSLWNLELIKSTLNKIVLRKYSLTRNFPLVRNQVVRGFWERRNSLNRTISGKATTKHNNSRPLFTTSRIINCLACSSSENPRGCQSSFLFAKLALETRN